jgi:gamma-glutamylcyclotransferase (GGCT)/AIG2-like uncharacterized protein YtfP
MHKVFVYGTLKQGHRNYRLLKDSKFLGVGFTADKFDMLDAGFPVLLPNEDGQRVKGELYEINDDVLERLDDLEGEGRMYDRKVVQIYSGETLDNVCGDDLVKCAIYIGVPSFWHDTLKKRFIPKHDFIVNEDDEDAYLEWKQLPYKTYRAVISFEVEAISEDAAMREIMEMVGDATIESLTEQQE